MANPYGSDVLASLNRILQYRQQTEKDRVAESLSLLQMAQQQKNLDRSFVLEEAKAGIGDTPLAKRVRESQSVSLDLQRSQLKESQFQSNEKMQELKIQNLLQNIEAKKADLKNKDYENFKSRMESVQINNEKNQRELSEMAISSAGFTSFFNVANQDGSDIEIKNAVKNTDFYKKLKKSDLTKKQRNIVVQRLSATASGMKLFDKSDDLDDMIKDYTSISSNIASIRNSLNGTINSKEEKQYIKSLSSDQLLNYRAINQGFVEEQKVNLIKIGSNMLSIDLLEKNIEAEKREADLSNDYKIDRYLGQKITKSDKELLDLILKGQEDIENIPPSFKGNKNKTLKMIERSINNYDNILNKLTIDYNNAKQLKNPNEEQIAIVNEFEKTKERILNEKQIQERVFKRVSSSF